MRDRTHIVLVLVLVLVLEITGRSLTVTLTLALTTRTLPLLVEKIPLYRRPGPQERNVPGVVVDVAAP